MGGINRIFFSNPRMKWLVFILAFIGATSAFDFSGLDAEQRSIEVPRIGSDVNVTCGGKEITIQISPLYVRRNSKWLRDGTFLSLMDPTCSGEKDEKGNIIIRVKDDFTKCKMVVEEVQGINEDGEPTVTDYKFTNTLKHDASENVNVAREIDLVEFNCVYPTEQITSNYMQPWIKTSAVKSKVKNLRGDMRLFKNENYTDFYTEPPILSLEEVLYVEVNLERPLISDLSLQNSDIVVVLEKCWGTPVADRKNSMRYYMIQDGCPVKGDTSLKVRSNGNSLQGKFDIKMFKFIGDDLNDVWLHCTVRACEATTPDSCTPECNDNKDRKKRSADDQQNDAGNSGKKLKYISLDYELLADLPIQRKRENDGEIDIMERIVFSQGSVTVLTPGTISFTVMLCVVSLVVLLAIVFGITCMAVRRRRKTMKALTESSNFSFHQ